MNLAIDRIFALILIVMCSFSIFLGFAGVKSKQSPIKNYKILELNMYGMIDDQRETTFFDEVQSPASSLKEELLQALDKENSNIKGVLIRINSPGGAVAISQEIHNAILKLREQDKFVIASMGDVAASGGYYIASACDYIYANPGTLTGSIGVISHGINYEGLMNKIGIKDNTIKAGKFKDIGSGTRSMNPEEQQILQNLINDTYQQFLDDIYIGRYRADDKYGKHRQKLTKKYIAENAEGLIYTGTQAHKLGLIDELGTDNDAKEYLKKLIAQKYKIKEDKINDKIGEIKSVKDKAFPNFFSNSLTFSSTGSLNKRFACFISPEACGVSMLSQKDHTQNILSKYPVLVVAPEFTEKF